MTNFFSKLLIKGMITLAGLFIVYVMILNQLAESGALQVAADMGVRLEMTDLIFHPIDTLTSIIEAQFDQLLNFNF